MALFSLWPGRSVLPVWGQTAVDDPWSIPINLSQSGSASIPQVIVDNEGVMHIIWQDSLDDYIYIQGDGSEWSEPVAVELPFGTRRYYPDLDDDDPTPLFKAQFIVQEEGFVDAFWIDDVSDLYHSRVAIEGFAEFSSWSTRRRLASAALDFSVAVGLDGLLHLAYLQTAQNNDLQPGLFYTQSDDGQNWLTAVPLFTSLYYRLMPVESANVQLAFADEATLLVAWDDWPNERVMLIRSVDGGESWAEVVEVDSRQATDDATAVGPSAIQIAANDELILLVWKAGHGNLVCNLHYQWSADGGEVWQSTKQVWERPTECPTDIYLEEYGDSYIIRASTSIGSLITPWDESGWGQPQPQTSLDTLQDPVTFKPIAYTCGQDSVTVEDTLWLVGCGAGEASQDIWFLNRPLASLAQEPTLSLWGEPSLLAETELPISLPRIVVDGRNRLHLFWGQTDVSSSPFPEYQTVDFFYSRWEDGHWSTPKTVFTPVSSGEGDLAVTADQTNKLFAVWNGAAKGELYFSQVAIEQSLLSSEWSPPQIISKADSISHSPNIVVGVDGVIYVAYIVPINEARGIYLVKSVDNGNSWTEPKLILDFSDSTWSLLSQLSLTLVGDDDLHVLWRNQSFGSGDSSSLYYTYSSDGGEQWSGVTAVTRDNQPGTMILWNKIIGDENGTIHRLWQEWAASQISLRHQISNDNGQTWSPSERIVSLITTNLPTTVTIDKAGQFHLLYFDPSISQIAEVRLLIHHFIWRQEQWQRETPLSLDARSIENVEFVAAEIGTNDQLAVLYSAITEVDGQDIYWLHLRQRELELAESSDTLQPTRTFTATPTLSPSPTIVNEPLPTATPTLAPALISSSQPAGGELSQTDSIILGMAAAVIPLGLILTLFLLWQNRLKKR